MRITQGWSGETRSGVWTKLLVEVDELDLYRILAERNLGDTIASQIPINQVFRVLSAEAERLLLSQLVANHGYNVEAGRVRIAALNATKNSWLDGLEAERG